MNDPRLKNIYLTVQNSLNQDVTALSAEIDNKSLTENERALLKSAISNMRSAITRLDTVHSYTGPKRFPVKVA